MVLRPRQHSIGCMGDGFYRSKDPTNNMPENVPANWNGNVEDGYSSSACVVCKQICDDSWGYRRVTRLTNADSCSKRYEYHKVL